MWRSGLTLLLLNLVSAIGAIYTAIHFWDDNRTVSYGAITALLAATFLGETLAFIAISAGFGFFAYALTEDRSLSFVVAILGGIVMIGFSIYRVHKKERAIVERLGQDAQGSSERSF